MKQLILPTLVLLTAASAAGAQSTDCPAKGSQQSGMMGRETTGPGMMDHDMIGPGMMGGPGMMRMIVIFMDTDGDGALSLEEVQAVHARMFKAMDADGNGRVTLDEMQAFMHGGGQAAPHQ